MANVKLIDMGDGNHSTVFINPAHAGIIKDYKDLQAELATLAQIQN